MNRFSLHFLWSPLSLSLTLCLSLSLFIHWFYFISLALSLLFCLFTISLFLTIISSFLHYFFSVSPCAYSLFLNCFFSHCLLLNILILLTLFSFCFSLQFNSIYYTISLLCPPLHVPFSHFFLSLLIALNSLHFSLDPLSTYLPR